ncbi:unnamed protein product [Caenorhabditis angaria]|uniref:Uncharacterized protein n=1 Tax=Caenorhabditis angaria TaxID=860376 RepID=A0A9P1IQT9_9PELO|nr:unnamed protein product [Caenorhabditis angaria]
MAALEENRSSLFDVDVELAKIAATCLTSQNYEQLAGNIVRHGVARSSFGVYLMRESVATIGLGELRAALGFAPPPPWQHFNDTKPSEDELSATPTIEAYYELREPRSLERSLDSFYLLENNMMSGIAFLDARFPTIRTMFKRSFEAIRQPGLPDRILVDHFIDKFVKVRRKVNSAIRKMHDRGEECLDVQVD